MWLWQCRESLSSEWEGFSWRRKACSAEGWRRQWCTWWRGCWRGAGWGGRWWGGRWREGRTPSTPKTTPPPPPSGSTANLKSSTRVQPAPPCSSRSFFYFVPQENLTATRIVVSNSVAFCRDPNSELCRHWWWYVPCCTASILVWGRVQREEEGGRWEKEDNVLFSPLPGPWVLNLYFGRVGRKKFYFLKSQYSTCRGKFWNKLVWLMKPNSIRRGRPNLVSPDILMERGKRKLMRKEKSGFRKLKKMVSSSFLLKFCLLRKSCQGPNLINVFFNP